MTFSTEDLGIIEEALCSLSEEYSKIIRDYRSRIDMCQKWMEEGIMERWGQPVSQRIEDHENSILRNKLEWDKVRILLSKIREKLYP